MAVRLAINESFVNKLKEESGVKDLSQLTVEAFSLLMWAIQEAKESRVLVSVKEQFFSPKNENLRYQASNEFNAKKVNLPSLDRILEQRDIKFSEQ